MGRAAPVTRLALAFAAGVAWALVGAPLALAPLVGLLLLAVPNSTSSGPKWRLLWVVTGATGLGAGLVAEHRTDACLDVPVGRPTSVRGRLLATPRDGSAPLVTEEGCGPFTMVAGEGATPPAGVALRFDGVWRAGRAQPWLMARSWEEDEGSTGAPRWSGVRWRDRMVRRLDRLYGERAPLAAALTLARREGLDPDLREAFARVGIAHLLAISGFHVGVIAVSLLSMLLAAGMDRRAAGLAAAGGAWLYVGFIGFPDAACRAALILTGAALSRGRGRPTARWGPIGAAFLILTVLDPRRLASPGFQLSFAGAAGLVAWTGSLSRAVRRCGGPRCPRGLATAVAAGIAATLATLPVVGWHFERVSLVGIPSTLLAAPLVTLALIGSLASLLVDFVSHGLASVLAGGVSTVLAVLERLARFGASLPWASAWTTRGTVIGGVGGVVVAATLARRPRVGRRARRILTVVYVSAGVLAWPVLLSVQGRGAAEIVMIDVGQGDAIALRGPNGRWLLVDTGPVSEDGDPAAHPVVRALKARGIGRLEALVLTHPDLDHIGGAVAVLESFEVGVVYDPGLPAGKEAFVDALTVAQERGVPWRAARAGDEIALGELAVRVLYPPEGLAPDVETNASSVVLHARLGDFDVLLTGDAYKDVDRLVSATFTDVIEVLKVGHHGSDTSTDPMLLEAARPELALVSVGRHNRYGHPAPEVLRRLEEHGVDIHRTDLEGTVRVLGHRDGSYAVTSRR